MSSAESSYKNKIIVMDWINGTVTEYADLEEASKGTGLSLEEVKNASSRNKAIIYRDLVIYKEGTAHSRTNIIKATAKLKELPIERSLVYQQEGSSKWYIKPLKDIARCVEVDPTQLMKKVKEVSPKPLSGKYIREIWEVDLTETEAILVGKCDHGGMDLSEKDSVFQNTLNNTPLPGEVASEITFYVDGSTAPTNPGPSAFGIWGEDSNGNFYNSWGYVGDMETNNRAEMFGYIRLLESVLHYGWKKVTAFFDSKYVLDNATRSLPRWKNNGWKKADGDIISNREQWERIATLQEAVKAMGITVTHRWVKGHSGDPGNEAADVNANKGRMAGLAGNTDPVFLIEEAKVGEEETSKIKKVKIPPCNKLINGKRLIFTTKTPPCTADGRFIYLVNSFEGGVEKTGRFIGKPASDNMYGVVLTKEPIPQLQAIISYQNKITPGDFVQPVVGILDRIVRPANWEMLTTYGNTHLCHNRLNITTVDKEPLTLYQRPARLAYDAINILSVMLDRLERFMSNVKYQSEDYVDITDSIYTVSGKKISLLNTIGSGSKSINIDLDYRGKKLTLALSLGIDLPDRNSLSGIAKQNKEITVSLLRYDSGAAGFRYAVAFKTENDYALYSTSMANIKAV
jgi:ribonuclease HI